MATQAMKHLGRVRWFDNLSQEGMIRFDSFGDVYINNDPVHGYRLMNGVALNLKSGDSVLCEVFEDTHWRQVSSLSPVKAQAKEYSGAAALNRLYGGC